MSAVLHRADCKQHDLPFPHRVITSTRRVKDRNHIVTVIVCALCGHWINRPMDACRCPGSCHMESRDGKPIGETVVDRPRIA
jgi:hypothetical protein